MLPRPTIYAVAVDAGGLSGFECVACRNAFGASVFRISDTGVEILRFGGSFGRSRAALVGLDNITTTALGE